MWCYERTEKTQTTTEREREARQAPHGARGRKGPPRHPTRPPSASRTAAKAPPRRYRSTRPFPAHSSGDLFGRHTKHDRRRKRERRRARERRKAGRTCERRRAPTPRRGGRQEGCKPVRSRLAKAMLALSCVQADTMRVPPAHLVRLKSATHTRTSRERERVCVWEGGATRAKL